MEEEEFDASEEELLSRFSRRPEAYPPAFQALLCGIAAAGLFALSRFQPELAGDVLNELKELSAEGGDLFPNPLRLISELFD